MAGVTTSPLAVAAQAAQRNATNNSTNALLQADPATNESNSFAQILKSKSSQAETSQPQRTDSSENTPATQPASTSSTAKNDGTEQKQVTGKDSSKGEDQDPATQQTDPGVALSFVQAALLIAPNLTASPAIQNTQAGETDSVDTIGSGKTTTSDPAELLSTAATPAAQTAETTPGTVTPAPVATQTTEQSTDKGTGVMEKLSAGTLANAAAATRQTVQEKAEEAQTADASKTVHAETVPAKEATVVAPAAELLAQVSNDTTILNQETPSVQVQSAIHQTMQGVTSHTGNGEAVSRHTISTPVGSTGWAEEIGQKLVWTANRDNGRAELVLTPPQLGRVEVSINMNGDQASATFVAATQSARDALQDALPRLREMFSAAGLDLSQTSVNAGNSGQTQADNQNGQQSGNGNRYASNLMQSSGNDLIPGQSRNVWAGQGRGLIDTFA